jgi:hypothetical protein
MTYLRCGTASGVRRALTIAALAAATLAFASITASGAMASQVLLSDEEESHAGVKGEAAGTEIDIAFANVGECFGVDSAGSLGKNPSGTVKVNGSDTDLTDKICSDEQGRQVNGGLTLKSVSVNSFGNVTVALGNAIEADNGCKYEVKKLTGTVVRGAFRVLSLTGLAKIQKKTGSPKSCAKATSVSAQLDAFPVGHEEFYTVSFI